MEIFVNGKKINRRNLDELNRAFVQTVQIVVGNGAIIVLGIAC